MACCPRSSGEVIGGRLLTIGYTAGLADGRVPGLASHLDQGPSSLAGKLSRHVVSACSRRRCWNESIRPMRHAAQRCPETGREEAFHSAASRGCNFSESVLTYLLPKRISALGAGCTMGKKNRVNGNRKDFRQNGHEVKKKKRPNIPDALPLADPLNISPENRVKYFRENLYPLRSPHEEQGVLPPQAPPPGGARQAPELGQGVRQARHHHLRGPGRCRQGWHDPALHGALESSQRPRGGPGQAVGRGGLASGISSAISAPSPLPARSSCSTARGTTARGSSG